jgi:hypothetical protein
LELPELLEADGTADTLIDVRIGKVPGELPNARHIGPTFQIGDDEFVLQIRNTARYRVRGGNEITVDLAVGASERNVRVFLLGSALGVLCHQRGLLPLHASAIEIDGRTVAFAGSSGAGKSTVAAYFHGRGYRVLTDDLCVVSIAEDGTPRAWPGPPRIKLWRDAVDALGYKDQALAPAVDGLEKYQLPTSSGEESEALPLAKLYVLGNVPPGASEKVARLTGGHALTAIFRQTYCRRILELMGGTIYQFERGVLLLKHVSIYQTPRRWGFDVFAGEMAKLERHAVNVRN